MTMVLLILWRYLRNLGTLFFAGNQIDYFAYEELKCMNLNVTMFLVHFFAVVLCTSWRQTMIVDLETLTWKDFKYAITSVLLGP
jgi:hypothetical protein